MPHHPSVPATRLSNIIACLTQAVATLNELHDAFHTPFVQAISTTTLALIAEIQDVQRNRDTCIDLLESIHGLLYAIITAQMKSEMLSPAILHNIGRFSETLHKMHLFVEAQQDGNRLRHFFRRSEMTTLLRDCRAGLQQAIEAVKIESYVSLLTDVSSVQERAHKLHNDLLELISTLSEWTGTEELSSRVTSTQTSSISFSLLPSKPQIFHGRESEISCIIETFAQDSPRIAILGSGGMGKTSLARTVLHHPDIVATYQNRFFVGCDSATTSIELAALIASHVGLKPGKNLTTAVIRYFFSCPTCLLVLDNLETPWESADSRAGVEEFLSLLTDIPHLALIITMRGAERPGKVKWSHPFLAPLGPLPADAAHETFIDIADDFHSSRDIDKLLLLTDGMPLAVDLLAHLVDHEGCSSVLTRWESEKTSLISGGYDKRSSLDASIGLSLSSPRITAFPGAQHLLGLLSILPDGLSDVELLQSDLSLDNILVCKSALLKTSLAYYDNKMRLRVLAPIRDHMQYTHPAPYAVVHAAATHFSFLLDLYHQYQGSIWAAKYVDNITCNLGNIQSLLKWCLRRDNPDLAHAIHCVLSLNRFSRITGRGWSPLINEIHHVLPQPSDSRLEAVFITEVFHTRTYKPVVHPLQLIDQAKANFLELNDPVLESRFYIAVGNYWMYQANNIPTATKCFETAVSLSASNTEQHANSLINLSRIKWTTGEYRASQIHAREAQRLCQLSGNLYEGARALHNEVLASLSLGDYKLCVLLCHRARQHLSLCGMSASVLDLNISSSEAEVHLLKTEYLEAHAIYSQTAHSASVEQDPFNYAFCLLNISVIDVATGAEAHGVHQKLEKAATTFSTMKYPAGMLYCEMIQADLGLRQGNKLAAKTIFQKCLSSSWENSSEIVTYCLERLSDISLWDPSDAWVSEWTIVYLGYSMKSQNRLGLYKALSLLADLFISERDDNTAQSILIVSLEGFTQMDVHRSRAKCMLELADIAKRKGDLERAVALWKYARPLFQRSRQAREIARIDTTLAMMKEPPLTLRGALLMDQV
ncbi:hypothetical protein K438DRAFT_2020105 [Mycena galopus ATCC 62051]|nr:hypothetical protein K438DRAFT_2020105 [Mycena galopus ATCC 62051]